MANRFKKVYGAAQPPLSSAFGDPKEQRKAKLLSHLMRRFHKTPESERKNVGRHGSAFMTRIWCWSCEDSWEQLWSWRLAGEQPLAEFLKRDVHPELGWEPASFKEFKNLPPGIMDSTDRILLFLSGGTFL